MDFGLIKERLRNMGIKRMVQNLLIVAMVAAIIVISTSTFFSKERENRNSIEGTDIQLNRQSISAATYEEQLEGKLSGILCQISGVGEVSVMVTLSSGKEVVPAFNTVESGSETNERDSGGGTRSVTQSSTDKRVASNSGSITADQPLIVKEVMPEVKGVIVVAEGAENPEVVERLTEAVQTVLGVPAFRVKVYPM
ncbi:MAG: stage III sporulation protein AG [Bacillota bacterium]|jgi:stage III sporulation protein AG|nr:stage III sporulation protein AG [Bacillota bacterium]MDD4707656.1 stage III sporulation protein AG [Bacillota bacterium]